MRRNKVASHFEREKKAIKKNRVTSRPDKEERIENTNEIIFEICFLDKRIIKYNWQKKKKKRLSTYRLTKKDIF